MVCKKNSMCRGIVFLIVISLLMSMTLPVGANAESPAELSREYTIIKALGIIDDKSPIEGTVTWGSFAPMGLRLIRGGNDIDFNEYVKTFKARGLLPEGLGPSAGDSLTYEQLAMFMVCLIRKDIRDITPETLGSTYFMTADMSGIFKNVQAEPQQQVRANDLYKILLNVLLTDVVEKTQYGTDSQYQSSKENLLKANFSGFKSKGIVSAIPSTSLTGVSHLSEGYIDIDGRTYMIEDTAIERFLGQKIEFYAVEDKEIHNYPILLYAYESDPDSKVAVEACNLAKYDKENGYYLYFDDDSDKGKKMKVKSDAAYIYNNFYASKAFLSDAELMPKSGYIELIDNDNDDISEVVKIYDVEPVVVKNVNIDSERIVFDYDMKYKGSTGVTLSKEALGTGAKYQIYAANGDEMLLSDIIPGNVLSIGKAKNNSYILFVSKYKGNGEIEQIETDGSGKIKRVGINDVIYDVASTYVDDGRFKLELDYSGLFYLDFQNKMVAFVNNVASLQIGYVISKGFGKTAFRDKNLIKLFDQDGKFKVIGFTKNVTVYNKDNPTGRKYADGELADVINSNELIVYDTVYESINKVYMTINSTDHNSDEIYPLMMNYSVPNSGVEKQDSRFYHGLIGSKYRFNLFTKVFSIPQDKNRTDLFEVKTGSFVPKSGSYYFKDSIKLYNVDRYMQTGILLMESSAVSTTPENDAAACVISNITKCVKEDEQYTKLECYQGGKLAYYYVKDDSLTCDLDNYYKGTAVKDLKRGDMVQLSANTFNEISGLRILFRPSNKQNEIFRVQDDTGAYLSGTSLSAVASLRFNYGKLIEVDGNAAVIINANGNGNDENLNRAILINNITNQKASFYEYNIKDNRVHAITPSELEKGDVIYMQQWYNSVISLVKIVD